MRNDELFNLDELKPTREDKKLNNLETYVPIVEKLGAIKMNDHLWRLGLWDIYISSKCSVRYMHNPKWVLNIDNFVENTERWLEAAEIQKQQYELKRKILKLQRNAR